MRKIQSRAQRQNAAAVSSKLAHDFWENDCVIDEDIFEDSSDRRTIMIASLNRYTYIPSTSVLLHMH